MRRRLVTIALTLPVLLLAGRAFSDITFPLGERYRIGKYLPVQVDNATNRVEAAGVVSVEVAGAGAPVVPVLFIGTATESRWPSRPLADDERLIGATTPDPQLAVTLFPQLRVEFASLNLADPLPGPAMAWQTLDAVFLDAATAARVTEAQLATLLTGGTTVAVRGERPAGANLWERHGDWWVVRPSGARFGGVIQPDQYAKFSAGVPGTAPNARRAIVLILLAFTIAVLAVSLWRPRRAWLVIVLISGVAVAAVMFSNAGQSRIVQTVLGQWTLYAAAADGELRHPNNHRDAAVWPILWSRRQAQDVELTLQCAPDGTPLAFAARLKRGQSLLFQDVTPAPAPATATAAPPR